MAKIFEKGKNSKLLLGRYEAHLTGICATLELICTYDFKRSNYRVTVALVVKHLGRYPFAQIEPLK